MMNWGQYYFIKLFAKSDKVFAYPTFTRGPLPPTALRLWDPSFPWGDGFNNASPLRYPEGTAFFACPYYKLNTTNQKQQESVLN